GRRREGVGAGTKSVVAAGTPAPAAGKQEPPQQAAGMVHAACRRPAIGAAEDRGMAESLAHARKLGGDGGERFVPGYLAEAIGAGAFLSLTPAVANGGPRDAPRRVHHAGDGVEHIRRRGVARKRLTADHAAVLD